MSNGRAWTEQEDRLIRQLYGTMPAKELATKLGCSYRSLVTHANYIGLRTTSRYTESEVALMRAEYPHIPTKDLAEKIGRPARSIEQWAKAHGIKKSPDYIAALNAKKREQLKRAGAATLFQRGAAPWNKGVSIPIPEAMKAHQFKPGNHPIQCAPTGAERITFFGHVEVKVQETGPRKEAWRKKSHLLWESAHGPIPPGHVVIFKNGNTKDVRIENLELVTRAEMCRRTHYTLRYPRELIDVINARAVLTRMINNKQRGDTHEKQTSRSA